MVLSQRLWVLTVLILYWDLSSAFRYASWLPSSEQQRRHHHPWIEVVNAKCGGNTPLLLCWSLSRLSRTSRQRRLHFLSAHAAQSKEGSQDYLRDHLTEVTIPEASVSRTRGVNSPATRSEAVSALMKYVSSSFGLLGAAGLAAGPASAEASEGLNTAAVDSIEEKGVTSASATSSSSGYTVGADEFGILFGDGPVGLKLGANPLKASGVCRVYVSEVMAISSPIFLRERSSKQYSCC